MSHAILLTPSPAAVLAAREAARHTQAEAAATIGLSGRGAWYRYESGQRQMDACAWSIYLLATGQHPNFSLYQNTLVASP